MRRTWHRLLLASCFALASAACSQPPTAGAAEVEAKAEAPTEEASAEEASAGTGGGAVVPTDAEMIAKIEADRKLAEAYVAGTMPEDMVEKKRLIIDATALGAAQLVGYYVIPGHLPDGALTTGETLSNAKNAREGVRNTAQGGVDKDRPAFWEGVEAGDYTVCVDVSNDAQRMLFPSDKKPNCRLVKVADDVDSRVIKF